MGPIGPSVILINLYDMDTYMGEMGELEATEAEFRTAVDNNGSTSVAIPADMADQLGIEPGDRILFCGREGEDRIEIGKIDAEKLLAD
jgi:predicted lysophospholipase L1 biosynthesis ABC-type transport system permease subunit